MKPQWAGNRGRGRGSRARGRGWRGNPSGPRGGGPPPAFLPMDYHGGPPRMRGHRGGYRGRMPPDNFNQPYSPHPNEPPWVSMRGHPYSPGVLYHYPAGMHQRRPFLSPPRQEIAVRPSSPLPGSEEYMQRDITEKSAFLKRQLELEAPPPLLTTFSSDNKLGECDFSSDSATENFCDNPFMQNPNLIRPLTNNVQTKSDEQMPGENVPSPRRNKRLTRREKKQQDALSVEEIHDKIINHISNLSYGKKINLVNQAGPSGYDIAVQQITRQKRLELSKALRDMCKNKFRETDNSSKVINAIIPDFDIKIEQLPREVVEQLSSTLNEDVEEHIQIQTMCIDPEVMFQQAADMLNNMLDVESEVKNDVNLADCGTPLQDEFNRYSDFQNAVESGDVGLDGNITQNIGDPSVDFVPNDTQMQPGCVDFPFDETLASAGLNFHNDPMQCQTSSVDFSVPPPMNFSIPPPVNFGVPPPSICEQPNNESLSFTDFSNSQHNNNLGISDDNYNMPLTQAEEGLLYPEANADDGQYYSPENPCSDENSLQTTPIFNDLMMGHDLLNDNNIEQADLSLPLNVDDGGILLQNNPCDNPPFNLMEDQESEQYFDLNEEVDDSMLMPPNEQPYNIIAAEDQLPENLTEQYLPGADEVDNIMLPTQPVPVKNVIREGKAIILSDIRIPPLNVASKVSDVLTEAAELEACLAQSEADLKGLDTSKSKKISFTFNKTSNFVKSKILDDDTDEVLESNNSTKKRPPKKKSLPETVETSAPEPAIKNEITQEPIKSEVTVEPVIEVESSEAKPEVKVDHGKAVKSDDPDPEQNRSADKTEVLVQRKSVNKSDAEEDKSETATKEENEIVQTEKLPDKEIPPEQLVPAESSSIETEQMDRSREKSNEKPSKHSKKVKSRSKSVERETPPRDNSGKKSSRKSYKMKQKSFDEDDFVEKKKEKKSKSKSSEMEEYPKTDSYKSKFERSRYDMFYSQKYEDGYKKKYKEKGREVLDEDRRRSDSDRSFEKYREKFRSSDSEHSENRYTKYHQEREEMRHSKRYYHECYPPYRTDYVDYKADYYNSQKYAYAPDYYSKQESPYSPEDFEAKSSHHAQKHKAKYDKTHKKRSKKHKRQREKSSASLSSISSEERDSSASSLNKKTKHKSKHADPVDTEDKSTSKGHKIPLKDRIQMLYESKFDRKRESSFSDYDEDRKIKSEPVSPEVSRKPSPERSRSVEKLQSRRESMVSADDLREALNKRALNKFSSVADDANINKTSLTKVCHPGTPVVPFTNKPCPARQQVEDPLREREEMIMKRDSLISFRNKPCPPGKEPRVGDELEVQQEEELQLAKELPDIDNIAKIISNLSTIVKPTKDVANAKEIQKNVKQSVKIVDNNEKTSRTVSCKTPPQNPEPKKFDQRPWKSPGEKKFMMEHLQRNPPFLEEELDYEPDKNKSLQENRFSAQPYNVDYSQQNITRDKTSQEEKLEEKLAYVNPEPNTEETSKALQEEKLVYINPEPTVQNPPKTFVDASTLQQAANVKSLPSTDSPVKILNREEKQNQVQVQKNQNFPENQIIPDKPKPEKSALKPQEPTVKHSKLPKETDAHVTKPKSIPKIRDSEEINSTSEKANKSVPKPEKLKEVETKPHLTSKTAELSSKSKLPSTITKPASTDSPIESKNKPQDTKDASKSANSRTRSKSRSRSKTKELELLHSAEVSSTSDTAAKSNSKMSVGSTSRSKSKSSTPQPPKEESSNFKTESGNKLTEQPLTKAVDPVTVQPEDILGTGTKMLITTYTQTQVDATDEKKDVHRSRKSSKREKSHSSSYHKTKAKPSVSTQTSVTNTNSFTQTPSARCRSVQVQVEVEEEKPTPKKAIFVQTDPVVIFENHDEDLDDKINQADKSGRRVLKAVRRRHAVDRMLDLDKEIERLTKLRQSLYKRLYCDSDSDEDEPFKTKTKVARVKLPKRPPVGNLVVNPDKDKPVAIKRKADISKKRKNISDASIEREDSANMEQQVQLLVNTTSLRTYKKATSTMDVKKVIESPTKNVIKSQVEAIPGETSKRNDVAMEETSIYKSVLDDIPKVNVEHLNINKGESKIAPEKLKPEQEHVLNTNLTDMKEQIKPKQRNNIDMDVAPDPNINLSPQQNQVMENTKNELSDKIPIEESSEKLNPPETPPILEEKQINENVTPSEQVESNSSQTDKNLPDKTLVVVDLKANKGNIEPELKKLENLQLETIPPETDTISQQTDLKEAYPEPEPHSSTSSSKLSEDVENPTAPKESPTKKDSTFGPNESTEEIHPPITKADASNYQPEKSDATNSETEDSVRSTRSKQRKPPQTSTEETAPAKTELRPRQRRKTEGETSENVPISKDHPKPDSRRKQQRKTDSESKLDTSVERDIAADEDAIQAKSRKRLSESKSPKRFKEAKTVLKVKVKTTDEQKKRFQANLKESTEVRSSPPKLRKKPTTEPEMFLDELSKTIDEVARNETGSWHEAELHKKEKGKEEAVANRNKLKGLKSTPHRLLRNSKEFEGGEMVSSISEKANESSTAQSDLQEHQDLTSDSVAFRGFTNAQNQDINKATSVAGPSSVASEESASSQVNGSFSGIFFEVNHSQKQKKRRKTEIELDPAIDSQNLLQVQMVKRPKSAFEPYTDGAGAVQKKKKRPPPFSRVSSNYRTKKRKSSSEANSKSASSARRKAVVSDTEANSDNSNIGNSIVRITRYSLLQLEEMRNSIREKKENLSTNDTLEAASVPDINEDQLNIQTVEPSECTESIASEPLDVKIESIESLAADIPDEEGNISQETMQTMPALDNCNIIEEEIHLKEEIPSVGSADFIPENDSCNSINSVLHLETSNEAFEDFVKESMHEYKGSEEPPVLTPEVDNFSDLKIPDCEYLEVLDEDDDYKMDFEGFTGAILVIKVIASTAIAASDKGKVFCFNMLDGSLINTFDMSKLAITSMIVIKRNETSLVYTGSLDSCVGVLNFNTKEVLKHEKIPEAVQCMEYAWNYIFIGSDRGSLIRYDLNVDKVEDAMKITEFNVLVIKATQEGPRKVLVVATRNAPVSIRDAMSGLLLRTMQTPFSPTVYTLLFEKNLIYCGTSQHDILVYTFEDGQLIFKHEATKSKGVVCMQIVGNLLFAGCYNGNIYVYNTKTNIHLGTMNGPGGLMLSMEIVRNKIIVGTKSNNFRAWRIPQKYLDQM